MQRDGKKGKFLPNNILLITEYNLLYMSTQSLAQPFYKNNNSPHPTPPSSSTPPPLSTSCDQHHHDSFTNTTVNPTTIITTTANTTIVVSTSFCYPVIVMRLLLQLDMMLFFHTIKV